MALPRSRGALHSRDQCPSCPQLRHRVRSLSCSMWMRRLSPLPPFCPLSLWSEAVLALRSRAAIALASAGVARLEKLPAQLLLLYLLANLLVRSKRFKDLVLVKGAVQLAFLEVDPVLIIVVVFRWGRRPRSRHHRPPTARSPGPLPHRRKSSCHGRKSPSPACAGW